LYPTQIQQAPGTSEQRTTTYSWHCPTGLLVSQTDVENSFTTSYAYDLVGRRTEVHEGVLRSAVTSYDDSNRKVTTAADLFENNDGKLQTVAHYDQLGRVRLTRRSDGSALSGSGAGGNREIVSNPYQTNADTTMGWTCTQHDQDGRVIYVGSFSGATAPETSQVTSGRTGLSQTSYLGEVTAVRRASAATSLATRLAAWSRWSRTPAPASSTTPPAIPITRWAAARPRSWRA
jgi:hypothetical protein